MKTIRICIIMLLCISAGHATSEIESGTYAVVTVQMGTHSYDAIRWNRASGESYLLRNQAWQPIPETDEDTELPEGIYEVQFIPLQNDWGAIRINTETGESWTMAQGEWIPIASDPEDTAEPEDVDIEDLVPADPATIEESADTDTEESHVIEVQPE